jgi:phosphatidylinositol alpha-1,6-mannosyltransferase
MILLITEVFPPKHGGSGRWFWELYRRLPHGSATVLAHDWPGADTFDRTHDLPIVRGAVQFPNWGVFNTQGLKGYARAARALQRVIRDTRPAVLHTARCVPEGFLAWTLRKVGGPPYWCYAHGEELTSAQTSREVGWMARRSLPGAERIIANSRNTRDMLVNDWRVPAERVTVLHPGVDASEFVPAGRNAEVRRRLGWNDRPVVLTVGALSERKGQDMMIRALPAIRQAIPEVLYVLVGEGWTQPQLEKLATELGVIDAVQFRGAPRDGELIECYQQCDLFALPNRRAGCDVEGFGIVLLEAQACGKTVLAGASGGTAETLLESETGTVIDCTAPDRLAEVVASWLRNPSELDRMGRRGRDWILGQFDWSVLVPQATQLFGTGLAVK